MQYYFNQYYFNQHYFNQKHFIDYINFYAQEDKTIIDPQKIKEAKRILDRYDGLCDIICNHITSQDILGDPDKMKNYQDKKNLESLLDGQYTDSHILNVNSITRFFQLIMCIVFKYYPESPLGLGDQKSLNSKDSNAKEEAIDKALDGMKAGDYYKLSTVNRKYGMPLNGHSMLIYKANDGKFTFFDPNTGAKTGLDITGIKQTVEASRQEWSQYFNKEVEISIMDNKKFLSKHHSQFMSELKEVAAQNRSSEMGLKR